MAVTALIQFTQNAVPGTSGQAYIGQTGLVVTLSNADNTSVLSWKVELLYAPPGSALEVVPGVPTLLGSANNGSPSVTFTPDIVGSYRIMLTVFDASGLLGQKSTDIRNFIVPTANRAIILPPYQKLPDPLPLPLSGQLGSQPDEMNYGGQNYGWAGNAGTSPVGLHELLQLLDKGSLFYLRSTVIASPNTIAAGANPIYVPVNTSNAGWPSSAGTVNLPTVADNGTIIVVQDVGGQAQTKPITVASSGTINGLSSITIGRNFGSATLVKTGSTTWIVWGAKLSQSVNQLLAGYDSTNLTGFVAVGGITLDPASFPNTQSVTFEVLLETTVGIDPAEVRLFNVTTVSTVSGTTLSTSNQTPTLLSTGITLASGTNVYEVQIRLQVGGTAHRVTCKQARIIVNWVQT